MTKDYYVYIYWRLDTNKPFYVGKGKDDRWKNIKKSSRGHNSHFMNIINSYPIAVTIEKDNLTENEAFYWEEEIIRILVFEYGYSIDIPHNRSNNHYCHLVNKTWGGEGISGCNSYENKTEEEMKDIKKKLSKASKGKKNPMYGKDWRAGKTEEELDNIHKKQLKNTPKGEKHPSAKSVICLTTNEIFSYGKKGAEKYKISLSMLSSSCKNKNKCHYAGKLEDGTKLVWMYLEDYKKATVEDIERKFMLAENSEKGRFYNKKSKSVICLTTKKIFLSGREASRYYNLSNDLSGACKGKYKYCGKLLDGTKLVWRYLVWEHNKKYRKKG